MAEEQFIEQERKRLQTEERKRNALTNTPMPGSVEEFLAVFKGQLDEKHLLQEYITREHVANKESIAVIRGLYERRLEEQNMESEIATLRNDIAELKDNFNFVMNQLLVSQQAHKVRVEATCKLIEQEITS